MKKIRSSAQFLLELCQIRLLQYANEMLGAVSVIREADEWYVNKRFQPSLTKIQSRKSQIYVVLVLGIDTWL